MCRLFYSWFGPLWFGVFAILCCRNIVIGIMAGCESVMSWRFLIDVLCLINICFYFYDYVRYRNRLPSNKITNLWLYMFAIIAALNVVYG